MATRQQIWTAERPRVTVSRRPTASLRFDWIAVVLATWALGGLYLDGWAHHHGRVDSSFLTPWHGVLYAGVFGTFLFLLIELRRGVDAGLPWRWALPPGYPLSLAAALLFLVAGMGDALWHALFGVEVELETLLSPTHLLLAVAGILLMSGPARSAWSRPVSAGDSGWPSLGPLVISAALLYSVLTFFTQFAHPISAPPPPSAGINSAQYGDLYVMDAGGGRQTRLFVEPDTSFRGGSWSPDGHRIVYSRTAVVEGILQQPALYVSNLDGSDTRRLTPLDGPQFMPAWSPDGRRIAFVSGNGRRWALYVVDQDGSNPRRLTDPGGSVYAPSWSPDSRRLLYTAPSDGTDQLFRIDADGSNAHQLTTAGSHNWGGVWSPDGRRIAYSSTRDGDADLYLLDTASGRETQLTDQAGAEYFPAWSPDGMTLAFVASERGVSDIYVINAEGGRPRNLTHSHALEPAAPVWSPDGASILFSAGGRGPGSDAATAQSLTVAGVVLQSLLMVAVLLLIGRRWPLPLGACTLLLGANGLLMTVFNDRHELALPAIVAGIAADLLLRRLGPRSGDGRGFAWFAFVVPVLWFALYFAILQRSTGLDWSIHLWLGAIVLSGIAGLVVNFLLAPPWIKEPRP